jgi:hypothetical protein
LQAYQKLEVTLGLRADVAYVPLAVSFVEEASTAFGMGEAETLSLMLAAEEVFAYLCRVSASSPVQMRCRSGGYFVEHELVFHARDFDMKAFNLTAVSALDEQTGMDETGLMIASRMVDRFRFFKDDDELHLVLISEKAYPESGDVDVPVSIPLTDFVIRPPDPEELKLFVHLARQAYSAPIVPRSFNFPGKVTDMAAFGEYHAAIAADDVGHMGGGIVWRWEGSGLVEFLGPYVFNQPAESGVAQALVDHCLSATARTRTIGLINRYPTPELPTEYFDRLGSLTLTVNGESLEMTTYFRHLEEDLGSAMWAHPLIRDFLANEYHKLFFAREIKPVRDEGESGSPSSVLSADFDRAAGIVTLYPIWWGQDSRETLAAYVETLLNDGLHSVFFEMDLGASWQCHFTPALLELGFEPRLVIPHAGKGDVVVFQYKTGESVS